MYLLISLILSILIVLSLLLSQSYSNHKKSMDTVSLVAAEQYIKEENLGKYRGIQVYVKPTIGEVKCELSYKTGSGAYSKQCSWVSVYNEENTHFFVNNTVGKDYKLTLLSSEDVECSSFIMGTYDYPSVCQTPYNSSFYPLNAPNTRVVELVPKGSTFTKDSKSSTVDMGQGNSGNIELVAFCAKDTSPRLNIYGSESNDVTKFVLVSQEQFRNESDLLTIDVVSMTNFRFFYVQVVQADAKNLFVKMIRKTW